MRIHIGLTSSSAGWQTLLQQEGVPFSVLFSPDQLSVEDFSVVIVHNGSSKNWKEPLNNYVRQGGALFMTGESYQKRFEKQGKRKSIRYLKGEQRSPFVKIGLVDIFSSGVLVEGATLCSTDSDQSSVLVESLGDGVIMVLPIDPGTSIIDMRKTQKPFYATGGRYPSEQVSLVSKGGVRKIVHAGLEYLHHERGIPYCHLSYFPDGATNAFALRVDSDYGTQDEIDSLYRFAEDHGLKMSWYLHTQSHEQWLSRFAAMSGHEMGVHCYEHAILRTYRGSLADLLKARDLLIQKGISPVGFAAPFGMWSPSLGRALEELGFLYSSEFSFDYDNLPSYPFVDEKWNAVLQIPIHPVCIGSFRKSGRGNGEMIEYFRRLIAWKLMAHEPLFFYHHPKDGHYDVLDFLINAVRQSGLPTLLFRDFAAWWKERLAVNYSVEFRNNGLTIKGAHSPRVFLRITRGTEEAIVSPRSSIDFAKMQWRDTVSPVEQPMDIQQMRSFSPELLLKKIQIFLRRKYK